MSSIIASTQNNIVSVSGYLNPPVNAYVLSDKAAAVTTALPEQLEDALLIVNSALTVGTQTYTLPDPTSIPGKRIKLLYSNTAAAIGQICRLDNGVGGIVGELLTTTGAGGAAPVWVNNTRYVQLAATAVAGSFVELISDGAKWFICGSSPGALNTVCFSTA